MLLPVKNILFSTDLSANSGYALRYALSVASAYSANVHVLHVVEPFSQDALVTFQLFMQTEALKNNAVKEHRAAMREALKKNQAAFVASASEEEKKAYDLVTSLELVEGHPAENILQRAKLLDCDLIVMATHEHSTDNTYLGTVAKRVLRRSSIPVLIVPSALSKD